MSQPTASVKNTRQANDHQKNYADEILAKIKTIDKSAKVFGGAARDWFLGGFAKDLDVYFYVGSNPSVSDVFAQLVNAGFYNLTSYKDFSNATTEYSKCPHIKAIFEPDFTPMPVQLILVDKPVDDCVLSSFDVDISLASYENGLITTDERFDVAVRTKTIRIINENCLPQDSYISKILNYFPSYAMLDFYGSPVEHQDLISF